MQRLSVRRLPAHEKVIFMKTFRVLPLIGWVLALGMAAAGWIVLQELRDTRADLRRETLRLPARPATVLPQDWQADKYRVLLVGDSRIRQWPALPVSPTVSFGKSAIGGETTGQLQDRFKRDVLDVDPAPDEIILASGINDLVAASVQTRWVPAIHTEVSDLMLEQLQNMADQARARGIKVRISTIVQPTSPDLARRFLFWDDSLYALVSAANARIPDLGHEVMDFNAVLNGGDGPMPKRFSVDTLHFNGAAYTALNEALSAEYLNQ